MIDFDQVSTPEALSIDGDREPDVEREDDGNETEEEE